MLASKKQPCSLSYLIKTHTNKPSFGCLNMALWGEFTNFNPENRVSKPPSSAPGEPPKPQWAHPTRQAFLKFTKVTFVTTIPPFGCVDHGKNRPSSAAGFKPTSSYSVLPISFLVTYEASRGRYVRSMKSEFLHKSQNKAWVNGQKETR